MPLAAGTRFGPYEILEPLGAGGMGEVYRARDTRLKRDVALKVLPEAFARDPGRMARFQREAEVLASLNHPNIAQIYGVEERALAMELVEGESPRGPMSFPDAWKIASQMAEALDYAHEKGIVHRDLKPANVKVTPEGVVKLLDFGLAKAFSDLPEAGSPDLANSPTITLGATVAGTIMGTAAYMSPEQARGKRVDKRADIWSWAVVLYELLTGGRLFEGEDAAETLAAVIHKQPDLARVPAEARRVLEACLQKDPKKRLRDMGDIGQVLGAPAPPQSESNAGSRSRIDQGAAAIATLLIALGAAAWLHFREAPPQQRALRYTLALPEGAILHSFALSPDGRYLAIAAAAGGKRQLWLRRLDALQAELLSTTEDARYPFWSPDSRYIGFFAEGKLRKIAAAGGPSQALCDVLDGRGGSWNRDDVIIFSPEGVGESLIQRVPASGGVPAAIGKRKTRHLFPAFLSDGLHFVYETAGMGTNENGIFLASLDGAPDRRLLADSSGVVFAPPETGSTGHLLFIRETNLMAQPIDLAKMQPTGEVFPVAEHVSLVQNNFAPVTVSANAALVYWSGGAGGAGTQQLVWYDRSGRVSSHESQAGGVYSPSIAPDAKTIAFMRTGGSGLDLWLRDQVRGTDQRFTSDNSLNVTPVWSPKGDRIVFASDRGAKPRDLYIKSTTGAGAEQVLLATPNPKYPDQWSRDGRFLVYSELDGKTNNDIWVLPMEESGDHKPRVFINTPFSEEHGQLSPSDRWMAYTSNLSGQREVYVRTFPASDHEQRISVAGGEQPRWSADGKELFYLAADGKMNVVPVKEGPGDSFQPGTPTPLFEAHAFGVTLTYFNYDVTGDGKRFLVSSNPSASTDSSAPPLTVMMNWNPGPAK